MKTPCCAGLRQDVSNPEKAFNRIAYLEILYAEHAGILKRYLYRRVGPAWADDVLQETFVQALSHLDKLNRVVSPRAWLFTVARNLACNVLRKRCLAAKIPWERLVKTDSQQDPRLETMRQAIEKLPEEHRETLLLRWYDTLSYEEIAQVLGIPVGTVRSRLHHALDKLRNHMGAIPDLPLQRKKGSRS